MSWSLTIFSRALNKIWSRRQWSISFFKNSWDLSGLGKNCDTVWIFIWTSLSFQSFFSRSFSRSSETILRACFCPFWIWKMRKHSVNTVHGVPKGVNLQKKMPWLWHLFFWEAHTLRYSKKAKWKYHTTSFSALSSFSATPCLVRPPYTRIIRPY